MICDFCGKEIERNEGAPISGIELHRAVKNGFTPFTAQGIDRSFINTLHRDFGIDDSLAIDHWRKKALDDTTDWVVCQRCNESFNNFKSHKPVSPEICPVTKQTIIEALDEKDAVKKLQEKLGERQYVMKTELVSVGKRSILSVVKKTYNQYEIEYCKPEMLLDARDLDTRINTYELLILNGKCIPLLDKLLVTSEIGEKKYLSRFIWTFLWNKIRMDKKANSFTKGLRQVSQLAADPQKQFGPLFKYYYINSSAGFFGNRYDFGDFYRSLMSTTKLWMKKYIFEDKPFPNQYSACVTLLVDDFFEEGSGFWHNEEMRKMTRGE